MGLGCEKADGLLECVKGWRPRFEELWQGVPKLDLSLVEVLGLYALGFVLVVARNVQVLDIGLVVSHYLLD